MNISNRITLLICIYCLFSCDINPKELKAKMIEAHQKSVNASDDEWSWNSKEKFYEEFEEYREKLTEKGFFVKESLLLEYPYGSETDERASKIWRDVLKEFPDNVTFKMVKDSNSEKSVIIYWVEKEKKDSYKKRLNKIISKYTGRIQNIE